MAAKALRDLTARIQAAYAAGGTGAQRVQRAALAYLGWAIERPARFKLVFCTWGSECHAEFGAAADAATAALRACSRLAVGGGSLVGDPDRIAAMVWALSHEVADLDLAGHMRKWGSALTADELVSELVARLSAEPVLR